MWPVWANNRSTASNRVGPARSAEALMITNSAATDSAPANRNWRRARVGLGAAGIVAAFLAAPAALADSADATAPADNMVALSAADPSAAVEAPVVQPAEASTLTGQPDAVTPLPLAGPADSAAQPPADVQHLSSPDNLPPGTTTDAPPQGKMDYLRYLWNAMRSQEVTPSNAMLLLAQRPMAVDAKTPSGVSATPSGPVGSSAATPASVDGLPSA